MYCEIYRNVRYVLAVPLIWIITLRRKRDY